jgi:hypothetical protein
VSARLPAVCFHLLIVIISTTSSLSGIGKTYELAFDQSLPSGMYPSHGSLLQTAERNAFLMASSL